MLFRVATRWFPFLIAVTLTGCAFLIHPQGEAELRAHVNSAYAEPVDYQRLGPKTGRTDIPWPPVRARRSAKLSRLELREPVIICRRHQLRGGAPCLPCCAALSVSPRSAIISQLRPRVPVGMFDALGNIDNHSV